jgi:hypothetical protein
MKTVNKMRLSKETVAILKNFAAINSNIIIKPGDKLVTVAPSYNIYAEAKVEEQFETEIPIWDLNQFLGIISMFSNPDLEFEDKYVDISNGRSSVRYYYSDPALLKVPKKHLNTPKEIGSFHLNEDHLNELVKAANILQVSDVKITAKNGTVSIYVDDSNNDTSNSFSILVDENYEGEDYSGKINVSEMRFVPGSYKVYLTSTIMTKFVHESGSLFYIISTKRD